MSNKIVKSDKTHESEFINEISSLMEQEEFRNFFNTHFNSWEDVKTVIMFMKAYQYVDKSVKNEKDVKLEKDNMAFLINFMIKDKHWRKIIVDNMIDFTEGKEIKNISTRKLLKEKN